MIALRLEADASGELVRSEHAADSEQMGPRRLLLLAALVVVAAACSFPQSEEKQIASCERDFAAGPASVYGQRPDTFSRPTLHRLCTELVTAGFTDASSTEEFLGYLKTHPEVAGDLCNISTQGLYGVMVERYGEPMHGYVTKTDFLKLGGDGCRYAISEGYGSFDRPLDFHRLFAAHPDLAVPMCAAPFLQAYDKGSAFGGLSRRGVSKLIDAVCLEAIRTGVVDYGSGDFYNPQIDRQELRRLLVRTAADLRARGEL
jgi:hypothetical protein